jgi:UDP-N-acetylmuramoylalanine--D-glutamate ligase
LKKRITILGAGESGTGAALLAKNKGYDVFVSDSRAIKLNYKSALDEHDILFEEGGHTDRIYETDLVIKSPGIPFTTDILEPFLSEGVKVIDEIEFAYQHTTTKVIAITGTNGKTTTTLLLTYLLKNAGIKAIAAGNVGKSFARAVLENKPEYFVVEISSFQLDAIDTFKPHIAILLNITPDHLDRYDGSMEKYTAAKMRIAMNMDERDHFIYYEDDPQIRKSMHLIPEGVLQKRVSLHKEDADAFYDDHKLKFAEPTDFEIAVEDLALKGPHNYINSMCAALAAKLTSAKKKKILKGLKSFVNAPHRMEKVDEIKEVKFINDSKATNVQSTKYALESFNTALVWIAGGVDKGNDYALINELVKRKVKVLICLGKDNGKLKEAFGELVDTLIEVSSIQDAVNFSITYADPGDVVLLSPACASFDLFLNYEDRGNQFKNAVKNLKEQILRSYDGKS